MLRLFSRVRLCDPMDCGPPDSFVHGILQARILGGSPCLPSGDLPTQGLNVHLLMLPALAGGFFTTNATWEAQTCQQASVKHLQLTFYLRWKTECLPLRRGAKQRCLSYHSYSGRPSWSSNAGKGTEGIQIEKENKAKKPLYSLTVFTLRVGNSRVYSEPRLARSQDTRSKYFETQAMENWKLKLRIQYQLHGS